MTMKILIAEDDSGTRILLQKYLERWGHQVVAASDGAEAWQAFEADQFPIVITDWIMPHIDGLELLKKIRLSSLKSYVYVLLLTSKYQKEDLIAGFEAGTDDFIKKPLDRDELRARLIAAQRVIEHAGNLSR